MSWEKEREREVRGHMLFANCGDGPVYLSRERISRVCMCVALSKAWPSVLLLYCIRGEQQQEQQQLQQSLVTTTDLTTSNDYIV